jgi:hypothetical protein
MKSSDVYISKPTYTKLSWLLSFPTVLVPTAMQMALAQQEGCHMTSESFVIDSIKETVIKEH